MATPIEYVEKQWEEWQENNPTSSFEHIDEESMKKVLIEDLTYASQMDVREYTLYQKWCEVKERYPVQDVSTLWGEEVQMVYPEQEALIKEVKNNFECGLSIKNFNEIEVGDMLEAFEVVEVARKL